MILFLLTPLIRSNPTKGHSNTSETIVGKARGRKSIRTRLSIEMLAYDRMGDICRYIAAQRTLRKYTLRNIVIFKQAGTILVVGNTVPYSLSNLGTKSKLNLPPKLPG